MTRYLKNCGWFLSLALLVSACGRPGAGEEADSASESSPADTVPFILDDALAKAKAENKPVLLEFTGSDWCPPCKALEKEVLSKNEFKDYKEKSLVFGKLDFPRRKELPDPVKMNNFELQKKFNIEGFPTLILLKHDGTELWRQVGFGDIDSPKELIAEVERRKQ